MNYYELLNIARDANGSEIKRAYFSAVKLHSPDSDPEGFKAIRIAYETLSDPKKRAGYDAWFTAPDDIQNELLAARELIRENKFKQALEFLTGLNGKNPDSRDAKRLLAEALWRMKKSGKAEKLCGELLKENPSDCETLLLCARIASSRGHIVKAGDYLNGAVKAAPLNPKAWIEYMHFALHYDESTRRVSNIFERAMELSPDMFLDDYFLYLAGTYKESEPDLFTAKEPLKYFYKFAECFIADKNHDENLYRKLMGFIELVAGKNELVPFIEKILPALENSRHRRNDDEETFKHIQTAVVVNKLRSDKRIHAILADLTEFLLDGDGDKNEKLGMECFIVFHIAVLRPSIKTLRSEYPECFKLNQAFYLDVLNERKTEFLTDKYFAIYKRLKFPENDEMDDGEFYDDFDETEEEMKPFVREAPKTGRNDPCPCGSGKKYKKCCG